MEVATFRDHVLLVGLGSLLMCFIFWVVFCLFGLFDFSDTASDAHVSTPTRALWSIVRSGSCICIDLPLFAVFDDRAILISIKLVDDFDMIDTTITMICSWFRCDGCRPDFHIQGFSHTDVVLCKRLRNNINSFSRKSSRNSKLYVGIQYKINFNVSLSLSNVTVIICYSKLTT